MKCLFLATHFSPYITSPHLIHTHGSLRVTYHELERTRKELENERLAHANKERDLFLVKKDSEEVRVSEKALKVERARTLSELSLLRERVREVDAERMRGANMNRFISKHYPTGDKRTVGDSGSSSSSSSSSCSSSDGNGGYNSSSERKSTRSRSSSPTRDENHPHPTRLSHLLYSTASIGDKAPMSTSTSMPLPIGPIGGGRGGGRGETGGTAAVPGISGLSTALYVRPEEANVSTNDRLDDATTAL